MRGTSDTHVDPTTLKPIRKSNGTVKGSQRRIKDTFARGLSCLGHGKDLAYGE